MLHGGSTVLTTQRNAYLAPPPGRCGDCEVSLQPGRWPFRLRGVSFGRRALWNPFRFSLS